MFQPPLVPFVTGPGYILSKSKSKFAVTLKDEIFLVFIIAVPFNVPFYRRVCNIIER